LLTFPNSYTTQVFMHMSK